VTRASILAYVSVARKALAGGDCEAATAAAMHAWSGLSSYNGWGKDALRRKVSAAYLATRQACMEGDELASRTYYQPPAHNPDLLPPGRSAHASNPDLVAPSFHGAGISRGGIMPLVGFALAVVGLGIGFGTLYKAWD
jgi:hypothetical protein